MPKTSKPKQEADLTADMIVSERELLLLGCPPRSSDGEVFELFA
jgi:hypothetical protein